MVYSERFIFWKSIELANYFFYPTTCDTSSEKGLAMNSSWLIIDIVGLTFISIMRSLMIEVFEIRVFSAILFVSRLLN